MPSPTCPSRARWPPRKRDVAVPATKRDLSHTSALLGVDPKEGFSNEIRSGHCCSYPISDDRAWSLSWRICKATWLQEHCKRDSPDRRLARRRHQRDETIFGRVAGGVGNSGRDSEACAGPNGSRNRIGREA